ncbi:MAG: MerR family transcriptional regulator [Rickettsiales bacterium]|nr:MerR family transcriptional regulator [Rickettsiales bacterium]
MTNDIAREVEKLADDFGVDKKRSIGDVAHELGVEPHVIRFWEEQFPQIKPEIGKGSRRYYYNKQLKVLKKIKKFLHDDGYTIAGLQKLLKKRKPDSHKEEDLDIIMISGDSLGSVEIDISDFIDDVMGNIENSGSDDDLYGDIESSKESPSANLVANTSRIANINKPPESSITKEQRDEISSLIKNITKNIGDLKMLLRS